MNWLKILYEFERFVFQIIVLIVLAPKTFFKIIRNPGWVSNYLLNESRKDFEQRFNEYLSPIVYWIIFSVTALILQVLSLEYVGKYIDSAIAGAVTGKTIDTPIWTDVNLDINRFTQAIILSIWYPLAFTTITVFWMTKKITRKSMELPFYLQCYAFGTFFTIYTIVTFVLMFLDVWGFDVPIISYFGYISEFPISFFALLLSLVWLLWFENTFLISEAVYNLGTRLTIFLLAAIFGTAGVYLTILVLIDIPNSILINVG